MLSTPAPPSIISFPASPLMVSPPAAPVIVSIPPPPEIVSAADPPINVSVPFGEPIIVDGYNTVPELGSLLDQLYQSYQMHPLNLEQYLNLYLM